MRIPRLSFLLAVNRYCIYVCMYFGCLTVSPHTVKEEVKSAVADAAQRIEQDIDKVICNPLLPQALTHSLYGYSMGIGQIMTSKGEQVSTTELIQCCKQFHKLLSKHFSLNIKKFELYSEEQIFRQKDVSSSLEETGVPPSTRETLSQLRAEYEAERMAYESLSIEKRELSGLLKEMQNALFDLRVSGQVVDSLGLQPLNETLARVAQQVRLLKNMCANAESKCIILITTISSYICIW